MKNKSRIVIMGIAVAFVIAVIIFVQNTNNNSFNKAKELFKSGNYYEAISEYYEKLNNSNKQKLENLILDEISNKKWKSQNSMKYGNYNDCLGNEYVEIENSIINHYVICGEEQYDYNGKSQVKFSLEENDNDKAIFKLSTSDNLYLFIYRGQDINIETGSVNPNYNYRMQYHKFYIEK